jgi:aminoglycoside phosphotransferase
MFIPAAIASLIGEGEFERIDIGCTGAAVYRITRDQQPTLFLKFGRVTPCDDLAQEARRLDWLQGRLQVPSVLSYLVHDECQYLLTTALPGLNGVDAGRRNPEAVVTGIARSLAALHSQPVQECPFDETRHARTRRAHARLRDGCVDETDFDDERRGLSAAEVWQQLENHAVFEERPVLTHGDLCLPNVLFDEDRVVGFVDCGRAGLADAYQDLALASRSIAGNLGAGWVEPFFGEYGLRQVDHRKLAFYRLLDEFF